MTPDQYLRAVAAELRDLPWKQRRDLVSELRAHLAELPPGANEMETPAEYAANLREAAGLERRRGVIAFLRARRPLNVALVALALIVLGLAIGAVAWINSYQPIAYGDATQFPRDGRSTTGAPGVTVTFREGRPFIYGVTIENTGRFTVRILDAPTYHVTDFFDARLFTNKPNPAANERPLVPFHPFDLHPGEIRWLVWRGVYACTTGATGLASGKGETVSTNEAIHVRYRFLWRTATAEIPLQEPLTMSFDKKGCPLGGRPWPKR